MNISTLSQQLNMSVQELRDKMEKLGFKVTPRQRKIDNVIARQVLDKLGRPAPIPESAPPSDSKTIQVPPQILVKDFASKMKVPTVEVIKVLIRNGVMAAMNDEIDFDTATIVATEFGFDTEMAVGGSTLLSSGYVAEVIKSEIDNPKTAGQFVRRPPIVAVMGHVDHGKTTLLDTLRNTSVAATEAGAITQHIGAYTVKHNDRLITFLDTPGHEAFTQMRARGANVTDLITLVVAADDGVKPQTVEVINRAKLSGVPMVVAMNKIDKPEANQERVKKQLSEVGVLLEGWGGKVPVVPISAKTGQNLDQLLEMILLMSDLQELKSNPKGAVVGTVIESHIERGQGPSATGIIQNGTLKIGDFLVAGAAYGRIRNLETSIGEKIRQAGPSTPVRVYGLSELPQSGDIFRVVQTLDEARSQARAGELYLRSRKFLNPGIKASGRALNLIVKADVQGSLDAIIQSLDELKSRTTEVQLTIVDKSVGEINESDVLRAESAGGTIVGFGTKPNPAALSLAKAKSVNIDLYTIIYELIEDVTKALVAMLSPEVIRRVLGRAKILAVFRTDGNVQIIGGRVEENKISSKANFIIKRGGVEIGSGNVLELQKNKQAVKEIEQGSEFGIKVEVTSRVEVGDVFEFFVEEVKAGQLT